VTTRLFASGSGGGRGLLGADETGPPEAGRQGPSGVVIRR
jgi:hypothetical protein